MQDAVDLLQPLLTDTVDYVKQGALIATALVLIQQPESKVHSLSCLSPAAKMCAPLGADVSLPCCHGGLCCHLQHVYNCSHKLNIMLC